MKSLQIHRQGDIATVKVDVLPEGLEPVTRENGRLILAYGEATGHAHTIADRASAMFRDPKLNELFMRVNGEYNGPIVGELVEANYEEGWFKAQTELRDKPIGFLTTDASFEEGLITIGPFSLIDHDEHSSHAIIEGYHKVVRQREYDDRPPQRGGGQVISRYVAD